MGGSQISSTKKIGWDPWDPWDVAVLLEMALFLGLQAYKLRITQIIWGVEVSPINVWREIALPLAPLKMTRDSPASC